MALEQVIELAEGHAWFQLYADQSNGFVDELIDRAIAADYKVLILTVDVPIPSVRTRDKRNGFSFPMNWGASQIWDFASHPRWSLETAAPRDPASNATADELCDIKPEDNLCAECQPSWCRLEFSCRFA
jgi:L-lactate dehydrogenase (cytochrome)